MDLTKPSRVFLNNAKRIPQEFADQFTTQLPAPVSGCTRLTIESALIEYNPQYPNFPPYANKLDISTADAGLVSITIPNEQDWTVYEVNGQSSFPKNFQEYLNSELSDAGSSAVLTIDDGTADGFPGFTKWRVATADIDLLGQTSLANPEQSIMERIGLGFRAAAVSPTANFSLVGGQAVFSLTAGASSVLTATNYILGRTSAIYLLSDLDNNAQSDGNIQNIMSVIPVRAGIGLGDVVEGEDTNSLTTSVNPSSDFNTIQTIILDDNYQPLELREEAKVIVEYHLGFDRPDSVVVG